MNIYQTVQSGINRLQDALNLQTGHNNTQQGGNSKNNDLMQIMEKGLNTIIQALRADMGTGQNMSQPSGHGSSNSNAASYPHAGNTGNTGNAGHADHTHNTSSGSSDASGKSTKHDNASSGTGSSTSGSSTTSDTGPVSKPSVGKAMPNPTGVVDVKDTIVVKAGQTFDGHGQYYRPTSAMGDGSQGEHQKPVFILEPGATLKNVQYSGADGIHLLGGTAKLDKVVNRKVGEDAITIDGDKNRAHDAKIAGMSANDIPGGPANVTITNSSFYGGKDKIIQDNGNANVNINGMYVDGAGKVFRTNGGQPLTTHVNIDNSTFTNVKEAIFRTDSKTSTATFHNTDSTNTPVDALAPNKSQVEGTNSVSYKPYTG